MNTHINPYSPFFNISPHLLSLCVDVWGWGLVWFGLVFAESLSFLQTLLPFTLKYFSKLSPI